MSHSLVQTSLAVLTVLAPMACARNVDQRPTLDTQGTASREATAELDAMVSRIFALDLAPGMAVTVVRDTQVIYLKGFGFADLEARRPVTPQTVFYIASTTKAFTALT